MRVKPNAPQRRPSTDHANRRPGVSGAMLATIAGLVVAIPSVFGYNLLLGNTREMITEIENYASSLADRLELEYK
jgi:biopolymer transport protein TolQ